MNFKSTRRKVINNWFYFDNDSRFKYKYDDSERIDENYVSYVPLKSKINISRTMFTLLIYIFAV